MRMKMNQFSKKSGKQSVNKKSMAGPRLSSIVKYDHVLFLSVILLCCLGLIVVYSSSVHVASYNIGKHSFYLTRQAMFGVIGFAVMMFVKKIPAYYYERYVYHLLLLSLILMILVLIPGIGHKVGRASRWFKFLGFSFQPSELLKLSLAVYVAYSMSKKASYMQTLKKGLLFHLLLVGIFVMLLLLQPDYGTAVIISFWLLLLLFITGVRLRYLFITFVVGCSGFAYFLFKEPYRIKRLLTFLHPWDDPYGISYQIIHSLEAFGSGGIFGTGIGSSKQALMFLPEAHTDFALSILAEEMGLLGVAVVILLFGIFVWRGIHISLDARDLFSAYLSLGLVLMTGLEAIINMCVVMSLLPNKGLPLPFISYGGSSLVFNLLCVGILLRISEENN